MARRAGHGVDGRGRARCSSPTSLPAETPEKWAEFLASLTHGPELARLTSNIASLEEVQDLCGFRALGCYSGNEMVSLGEPARDGTTAEEVLRHEYGHHVAWHRVNTPWRAIEWGPKHWASCGDRVLAGRAGARRFRATRARTTSANPGEAWAEVYRLMDERKVGITTATWPIIDASFYPDEPALLAAERDVLEPWTANRKSVFRRSFARGAKKAWWIPLPTPLDGNLVLNATLPRDGTARGRARLGEPDAPSCGAPSGCRSAESAWRRGSAGSARSSCASTPSGAGGQVTVTVSRALNVRLPLRVCVALGRDPGCRRLRLVRLAAPRR